MKQTTNASTALSKKAEEIRNNYLNDPAKCNECNIELDFYKRANKFCSKSCAANFNNRNRSSDSREKQANTLSKKIEDGLFKPCWPANPYVRGRYYTAVEFPQCKICNTLFTKKSSDKARTTCSKSCRTTASTTGRTYQNGSRKPSYYYNRWQQKDVLLESSWEIEIAKFLDDNDVKWVRPEPLEWFDTQNVRRLYYSDFYIPSMDLYLDPKNPYCMQRDKAKLEYFETKIKLLVGNPAQIISALIGSPK